MYRTCIILNRIRTKSYSPDSIKTVSSLYKWKINWSLQNMLENKASHSTWKNTDLAFWSLKDVVSLWTPLEYQRIKIRRHGRDLCHVLISPSLLLSLACHLPSWRWEKLFCIPLWTLFLCYWEYVAVSGCSRMSVWGVVMEV